MNKNDELEILRKENEELRTKLYQERQEREETIKRRIQENCDHDWIHKEWVDACFYTCRCRKCGKVQTFYRRD